jgi:hypothetical protein
MHGLKKIVIDDVKLRDNVACTDVVDKVDGAGVRGGGTHVLALARLRLPFRHLSSILELRLEHVHWAAPGMGIDKGAK